MSPGAPHDDDFADDETQVSERLSPIQVGSGVEPLPGPVSASPHVHRRTTPSDDDEGSHPPIDPAQQITAPESFPGDLASTIPKPVRSLPSMHRTLLDAPMRVRAPTSVVLAVLFHLVIFAAAFVLPRYFDSSPHLQKPIIAKLVAMGKPRDKSLLPRAPETPPPPPPSQGPVATPTKPTNAAPVPAPKSIAQPRAHTPTNEELMERAMARASKGVESERHQVKPEEREGAENGSADATATSSEEGDQYFAAVQAAILTNYALPSIISERERMSLKAIVDAWIGSDGTIIKYVFEQRSGNHFFDEALELAIKRTKVPPPPPDRAAAIRRDGVALVFTP